LLTLLEYAAQEEVAESAQPAAKQEACLREAAYYLEQAMLAVLKVEPDRLRAEDFQSRCLKLYRQLSDQQAIQRVERLVEETCTKQEELRKSPRHRDAQAPCSSEPD